MKCEGTYVFTYLSVGISVLPVCTVYRGISPVPAVSETRQRNGYEILYILLWSCSHALACTTTRLSTISNDCSRRSLHGLNRSPVFYIYVYTIYTNHVSTRITWQYVWVNARTSVTKYRAETRRNVRDTVRVHRYFEKKSTDPYIPMYVLTRIISQNMRIMKWKQILFGQSYIIITIFEIINIIIIIIFYFPPL